jgi:hypothetical protein
MARTKPPTSSYPPTPLAEDQARRKLRESMNPPPGSNRIGTILSDARDAGDVLGIVANKVREGVKSIKRSLAP